MLTNDNADSQNLAGAITFQLAAPNLTPATAIVNVTGQVARLAISAPAATTAGDTFNVNVAAIDTTGEVATGYSTTVHFASNDTLGGLPADYTFTPADAGTHVFAVTLKSSGSRFISAVELGGSIQGGVSVSVAPQVATTLVLAGAAGAIGVTRTVTIAARDVFGNFATGYVGTVHFTSSDPAAVLPADVALSNGSALVNVNFFP